jgi:hypothetical protein
VLTETAVESCLVTRQQIPHHPFPHSSWRLKPEREYTAQWVGKGAVPASSKYPSVKGDVAVAGREGGLPTLESCFLMGSKALTFGSSTGSSTIHSEYLK